MVRTAFIVAFSVLCLTTRGWGQEASAPDSARLNSLRQRAERGDVHAQFELGFSYEYQHKDYAEALQWYRKAAEQGSNEARISLGKIYFEGTGVKQDYAEAARWYGCPKPSAEILASCRETSYKDLPRRAVALLNRMKCDIGTNYDYGSAVDLNGDGISEYQVCCHDSPHGPCNSVVIGKVGTEWKDLTAKEGLLGFEGACNLFVVLESQHKGFHDVCLPTQCSVPAPAKDKTCSPTIWQFNEGRYRSIEFTPAKPPM